MTRDDELLRGFFANEASLPLDELSQLAAGELGEDGRKRLEALAERSPAIAAELALARAFGREDTVEDADVDSIVARLRAQPMAAAQAAAAPGRRLELVGRVKPLGASAPWGATLRMAASLAVVVGAGLLVGRLSSPPDLPEANAPQILRAASVVALGPAGELALPPRALEWTPVAAASSARVVLRTKSGEVLLEARVSGEVARGAGALELPAEVVERLATGVHGEWLVELFDASDQLLARSELTSFRVVSTPADP